MDFLIETQVTVTVAPKATREIKRHLRLPGRGINLPVAAVRLSESELECIALNIIQRRHYNELL